MTHWKPKLEQGEAPLYRLLSDAMVADIASGRLRPGDRLPTHRELAELLDLSVGTVTRAYQEAEARGAIDAAPGRGTFVRDPAGERSVAGASLALDSHLVDLSLAHPHYAQDPDLASTLKALSRHIDLQRLLRYQDLQTNPRCRDAGAEWLEAHGMPAVGDRILITAGAQHAVFVLLTALTEPGELLLLDQLTYPGVLPAAAQRGLRVRGIPMDESGMIPDALRDVCKKEAPRALYLVPTIHNPTSIVVPEGRRRELATIAEENDLLVIEDDILRLLVPDPPPPVSSFIPERSFFIASMSKSVAGGLRMAYLTVPPAFKQKASSVVGSSIFMVAPLSVEIATLWIEDGTARRTVERKRQEAEDRQAMAGEILKNHRYSAHPQSYYVWLELPEAWNSAEFAVEARRRGVGVTPSGPFTVASSHQRHAARLCLSAAEDRSRLETALRTLSSMLSEPGIGTSGIL